MNGRQVGVNVNAIAPGYIRTDNTQALQDDPERSTAILGRIPADVGVSQMIFQVQ